MGEQVRPGIWADDGVEIQKGARIVAPAYLGRRCTIGKTALVTRFSNIERDSHIDYGTVIENSSILPNTYIGVWLDVRHSVVHGNKLLNLERDVLVEVCDSRLLRCNGTVGREKDGRCASVASASDRSHEKSLLFPDSARFYTAELKELLWKGEFRNTLRIGLLPLLATAAAVEYRITGSDRGI